MKEKPKYSIWQSVLFMVKMAWKVRKSVLAICFISVVLPLGINLAELYIGPIVLAKVENHVPLSELVGTIGFFSLVLVLSNGLLGYMNNNNMFGRVFVRLAILYDINDKSYSTSYPNTLNPKVQKLQEKALNACSRNVEPTEHIWTTLTLLLQNIAGLVLYMILLTDLNIFLILIVILTTILGFSVSKYINEWGYRHREEEAEYQRKMGYILRKTESVILAKDIRIFGLAPWLNSIYQRTLNLYDAFINRRERIYVWSCVVDVILSVARNSIAYIYLINKTINDGLAASEFLLYFTAFTGFSAWITGVLQEMTTLHKESLGISMVQEYINYPEQFRFQGGIEIPKADAYELKLVNVTFCYPGTDKEIIRNLNLTIHPGEKIAVVGLNGAGKTTLVKLLCGFYDPSEGRVLLNGIDIREFNRQEYYRLFSAVFQEFSDLDITVAETVAQTVTDIDMKRVKECISKAGLSKQVEAFPKGYHTHLGRKAYLDGIELSGGQFQRLMLARALYKDGPFLILDEPTAALDPIAENDIYTKYNQMTREKSSVFISHRLASTRFCDRILFLKNGVIIEEGTHEELINQGGEYAKLYDVQARYYQEGRDFDGEAVG